MIKAICLLLSTTLQTPKRARQKWLRLTKGLTEEHDNIQNFGCEPTTSLGQWFGENLVIFCKLSTLIRVTNGASHPYHLDDSTFNYRDIKSHIPFYYLLRRKSTEWDGMFVASHLVLFYEGVSVHSKRPPCLYGLNDSKLEFHIQAQRQRNLTYHKKSKPPREQRFYTRCSDWVLIAAWQVSLSYDFGLWRNWFQICYCISAWRSFCDVPGPLMQTNALYP